MPPKRLIVGIDPGANTGVSILRKAAKLEKEKVLFWGTKDFITVQDFLINTFPDRSIVRIFVEHPPTFIYARNDVAAGPIRDKKQQMMAANRKESELLAKQLERLGFEVHLVPPVHEKKWDQKRLELFTGLKKRSSEHERDAVRLAVYYANKR